MKKKLLGSASSRIPLEVAINPIDPGAVMGHHEAKVEGHDHGPKPAAVHGVTDQKGHKPKNAGIANPANAFRGASRGS